VKEGMCRMKLNQASSWVTLAVAVALVAFVVSQSFLNKKGARCRQAQCTYIDSALNSHKGKCVSKAGDSHNCYCRANDNTNLAQVQSGCSLK